MAGRFGGRRTCGLLTLPRESRRMLAISCRQPEKRTYAAESEKGFQITLRVYRDAMTHSVAP